MTPAKKLVLDANILIRAVLGIRVAALLNTYDDSVAFYTPAVCFDEARRNLPGIIASRRGDREVALKLLAELQLIVEPVDQAAYADLEQLARERMAPRDIADWPIAAVALMLGAPVWTEDRDFFGSGIATWTTDRVELYLQGRS